MHDRARREELYGEFTGGEASRLFVDAFEHDLEDPAKLRASPMPSSARSACSEILRRCSRRKRSRPRSARPTLRPTRTSGCSPSPPAGDLDPLFAFSKACRDELKIARSRSGPPSALVQPSWPAG